MLRRLLLLLTTLALAVVMVTPASAATTSTDYVNVWVDDSGAHVRSGVPGQPLVSADAGAQGACVGFSLQVPFCVDTSDITEVIGGS